MATSSAAGHSDSLIIRGGMVLREGQTEAQRLDLLIRGGRIERMAPVIEEAEAREVDARGLVVCPPFVESHVHLDSALVDEGRCLNESGTLFEGIELWREMKQGRTEEQILSTARRALMMQARQGVLVVRSHADISHPELRGLKALLRLKEEFAGRVRLEIVAFPQDGVYGSAGQLERLEEAVRMGADVIGGIPHYELMRTEGERSLEQIFALAAKHDVGIDVHCDEVDDPSSRFLEVMAALAIRAGNGQRVTASHTTAFGSYDSAYADRLMRMLGRAKMNFVANPLVNMVLQGRSDSYPKRRGLTRVKELWQAGLNVSLGYDCLMDPWYALGTGNMLDAGHMAVHACHMMGRREIDACFDMVTWKGARTLGLEIEREYDLREGSEANLVVLPVGSRFEAIRLRPSPACVVSRGKVWAFDSRGAG